MLRSYPTSLAEWDFTFPMDNALENPLFSKLRALMGLLGKMQIEKLEIIPSPIAMVPFLSVFCTPCFP